MEFQEFWKQGSRYCKSMQGKCNECEIQNIDNECRCLENVRNYPKKAGEIIQKWADEHPVQTNAEFVGAKDGEEDADNNK